MNLLRILISGYVEYYIYLELHCSTRIIAPLLKNYSLLPNNLIETISEQE